MGIFGDITGAFTGGGGIDGASKIRDKLPPDAGGGKYVNGKWVPGVFTSEETAARQKAGEGPWADLNAEALRNGNANTTYAQDPNLDMSKPGLEETWGPTVAGQIAAPGAGENQWAQYGQFYNTPQAGQNYTGARLGVADMGMRHAGEHSGSGNMAAQMFGDFQATAGQNNPGMGAYYENAARVGQEGIDRAAASRGAYGASSAMDASAEMNTNLAADRAKNEADYNLRRLSTGSEIAQGAEASQRGWADSGRGWFDSGTGAASQMDQDEQARVNAGMTAAGNSQRLEEGRLGQFTETLHGADTARGMRIGDQLGNISKNDANWASKLGESDRALYDNMDSATKDYINAVINGDDAAKADAVARGAKVSADVNSVISAVGASK